MLKHHNTSSSLARMLTKLKYVGWEQKFLSVVRLHNVFSSSEISRKNLGYACTVCGHVHELFKYNMIVVVSSHA